MNNRISKIVTVILKNRWQILILISLITLISLFKISSLRINNDLAIWFKNTDTVYRDYKVFNNHFNDDRLLVVAYRSDSIFSSHEMDFNRDLSNSLENIKGVKEVISLTNVRIPQFTLFNTNLSPLISRRTSDFNEIKRKIKSLPIFIDNLVSEDLNATGFQIIPEDSADCKYIYYQTKSIVNSLNNSDSFIVVGGMALIVEAESVSSKEPPVFLMVAVLIIIVLLIIFFKRIKYAVLPILIALISIIWIFFVLELVGGCINMITGIIPLILLATSVPFSVHFLVRLSKYRKIVPGHKEIIIQSISEILFPGSIAAITTALAFLVFAVSEIVPIQHFGWLTSLGILISFVLSLVLLPIFISFSDVAINHQHQNGNQFKTFVLKLTNLIRNQSKWILIISVVLLIVALDGISKLKFESDQVKYFKKKNELRLHNDIAGQWFNGVYPFEVIFDFKEIPEDTLLYYFDVLRKVEADLIMIDEVEICHSANGLIDAIKTLNKISIPRSRIIEKMIDKKKPDEALNQSLKNFITGDKSHYRLTVKTKWIDNSTGKQVVDQLKQAIKESLGKDQIPFVITGASVVYLMLNYEVMRALRTSISFSFIIIFLVLIVSFKKPLLFISGIIPNIFPVINTLGIMGFLDIPIDVGTVLIASISLGIAVDDTVYFINAFRHNRLSNQSIEAIKKSYQQVWKSLSLTTIILITGFSIMITSSYSPIIYLGVFVSLNLMFALVYDTLVLPAMLYVFSNKSIDKRQ